MRMLIRSEAVLLSLLIGLTLAVAGCGGGGGGDGDGDGNVFGVWRGTYTQGGISRPLTLTVRQSGNAISGTWKCETCTGAAEHSFTGTLRDGTGTLTVAIYGEGTIRFSGNTATGSLPSTGISFVVSR